MYFPKWTLRLFCRKRHSYEASREQSKGNCNTKIFTEVILNAHDNFVKKKESIVKKYYISRLEEKLKDFISCCIPCIIVNRKVGKKEGELIPLPKSSRLLGLSYHMIVTHKAYQHILVVIDCFFKFGCIQSKLFMRKK